MSRKKSFVLFLLASALCSIGGLALTVMFIKLVRSSSGKLIKTVLVFAMFIIPALLPASVYNILRKRFDFTRDYEKTKLFQWLIWAAMCYLAPLIMISSETLLSLFERPAGSGEHEDRAFVLFVMMAIFFFVSVILTAVINVIIKRKKVSNFKEKNDV